MLLNGFVSQNLLPFKCHKGWWNTQISPRVTHAISPLLQCLTALIPLLLQEDAFRAPTWKEKTIPVMTWPRKRYSKLPLPSLRPSQRAGEHRKQQEADNGKQRSRSLKANAEAEQQQSGHSLHSHVTIWTGVNVFTMGGARVGNRKRFPLFSFHSPFLVSLFFFYVRKTPKS